jgi:hypothetical protein
MRQTLLLILFFTFQNSFGQFGIIRDKTGLVNVRKSPEISNNIIDTLHDGQVIFYYNVPEGEWYDVEYEKDHMTLSGFVHQSRFKFLTEFDSIPAKQRTKDRVIFQKGSFKITLTKVPFVAKNNKLQYSKGDDKSNTTSVLEKINHKKIWGTDGEIPKTQYGQVSIEWGDQKIVLPKESLENLYEPNLKYKYTSVCFDKENNTMYIYASNSDGAGAYEVLWVIENGKYKSRHLSNAYA